MRTANAPLVVDAAGENIVYAPYNKTVLILKNGQEVYFVCPGGKMRISDRLFTTSSVLAKCEYESYFHIRDDLHFMENIACTYTKMNVQYNNKTCDGGKEVEIGFSLNNKKFIKQILICFDEARRLTLYTHHQLRPIAKYDHASIKTPRPRFRENKEFYNFTMNDFFYRSNQRRTINQLLGLQAENTKYVQNGSEYFLSRGHLSPRADFMYAAEMNGTFNYINVAPQWQTFNGKNWMYIEDSIRNFANKYIISLDIWTGTYGVSTLLHGTSHHTVPLYLFVNGSSKYIPVPALFWKVVYHQPTQKGIVILGVNNPYQQNISHICPDVGNSIKWLKWNRTKFTNGYTYACSVPEFQNVYKSLPKLNVSGLLL